ncbi:MAG: phosphoribosyl 1,2-cyclic phosphate phosphodiesterase [Chthoniobacter sp.]|nr:phosphoribosyl 1,2-cyclic phosphate phosphodiesterase [Chthoniobacter sp.]
MADLIITFLGTGTSQGVPMIGCDCDVCTSADTRDQRMRSSIYVQTPECSWVIDTGPDFRSQCLRERVRKLDAVVFTHAHTDHIMGFDDLRSFCQGGRELPIFASTETMEDLQRVFAFAFKGQNVFPGYLRPVSHIVNGPFSLGKTELTPLPVQHGRASVNGYLFSRDGEKLAAYLSDCKEVPDATIESMRGVRTLIIDALRHREHPTHMNIAGALDLARRIEAGATWLTHICHDLPHAATEAGLPSGVRMAFDGLKLTL